MLFTGRIRTTRQPSEDEVLEARVWIATIARKMARSRIIDEDDLIQEGMIGFLEAYSLYRIGGAVSLRSYAEHRVRGAMLDYVRKKSRSRTVRKQVRDIDLATAKLRHRLGRDPDEREIAAELGIRRDTLQTWKAQAERTLSLRVLEGTLPNQLRLHTLTRFAESWIQPLHHTPDYLADLEKAQRRDHLAVAFQALEERDQKVLWLIYMREAAGVVIQRFLRVNQSRVSQLHRRALIRLKAKLLDKDAPRPSSATVSSAHKLSHSA
jgi:RNA polymerase sigma factor for flagellar operon FliA